MFLMKYLYMSYLTGKIYVIRREELLAVKYRSRFYFIKVKYRSRFYFNHFTCIPDSPSLTAPQTPSLTRRIHSVILNKTHLCDYFSAHKQT